VRTVVVSDLHLGARTGADLLRRPAARAALVERLDGADRLVLLGDTLELRHGPVREVLAAARPVLEAIGAAMRGGEIVLVAGNHDHRLVSAWLEGGGDGARPPALGLEERAGPDATAAPAQVAALLAHRAALTDEELLGTLGGSLAAIIANARLLEQIRAQAERERVLFEISDKIRRTTDMETILTTTVSELTRAVGASGAKIRLGTPPSDSGKKSLTDNA